MTSKHTPTRRLKLWTQDGLPWHSISNRIRGRDMPAIPCRGADEPPPRSEWYRSEPYPSPYQYCNSCGASGCSGAMMIHHYPNCEFRPGGGCEIDDISDRD